MEGENTSPMSSLTICERMEFEENSHASIHRNKMELLSGRIGHVAKIARVLMSEKSMPHSYWVEAVSTAVYIMSSTPTAAIHDVTLEEKYTSKKPDASHLKVFRCISYVHVLDELHTKLDTKAKKLYFPWLLPRAEGIQVL